MYFVATWDMDPDASTVHHQYSSGVEVNRPRVTQTPLSSAVIELSGCLQRRNIRTVFKSEATLRSHTKDTVDLAKQDGAIQRILCECGESGRPLQAEGIKGHDKDIRLVKMQTSSVSEYANNTGHRPLWKEVKFIYGS